MKALLIALLAASATPALAQHAGHHAPAAHKAQPAKPAARKAAPKRKPAAATPARRATAPADRPVPGPQSSAARGKSAKADH